MESPVVLEKPTDYHGKGDERGFPFDEDEGSGAWSSLAARHPDIAARLRQRPATWARKRRPSSQDAGDDFGDSFGGFDRFPFDDIPPEFRESFPSHWSRRFEEAPPAQHPQHTQQAPPAPASPQPQQASATTQTEPAPSPHAPLPQYGLRNTVDLGQRSAADPSVDADERGQRSMSAPPPGMSAPHEPPEPQPANVRHIPIFVEGRDEPVINKSVDHGAHFGETKPHYAPPPQPHVDRDQYFADDGPPAFHHPPNFSRAFGTPFNKGFRQGPQPFTQQKAYPQTAFARGASPQRSQSPKQPHHEEFVKTHHEPRAQTAPHPPQHQQQQQQHKQQQHQHQQQQQQQQHAPPPQPPHAPSPPPKQQPVSNDPITVILAIQTDVLNLMSEVENFAGTKNDKKYLYLDEMLTRNLIKLDNIETDGKENIRQARREAIKCIQKCIAVLEAKAESNAKANASANANAAAAAPAPTQEVEMAENGPEQQAAGNGEVEMQDDTKEEAKPDAQVPKEAKPDAQETKEAKPDAHETKEAEQKVEQQPEQKVEPKAEEPKEAPQPPDTRPETRAVLVENKQLETEKKTSPKKKVVKKRDKSKDNTPNDSNKEGGDGKPQEKEESMQVDDKGDQSDSQKMEVDGASASQ